MEKQSTAQGKPLTGLLTYENTVRVGRMVRVEELQDADD